MYGSDICLFDATYRTTRYALPLFFVCVRTNVCYVVVGVMVVQEETTQAIREGLEIFKSWNMGWKPAHFMVDYSVPEIKAVESVFEGMMYRKEKNLNVTRGCLNTKRHLGYTWTEPQSSE